MLFFSAEVVLFFSLLFCSSLLLYENKTARINKAFFFVYEREERELWFTTKEQKLDRKRETRESFVVSRADKKSFTFVGACFKREKERNKMEGKKKPPRGRDF